MKLYMRSDEIIYDNIIIESLLLPSGSFSILKLNFLSSTSLNREVLFYSVNFPILYQFSYVLSSIKVKSFLIISAAFKAI